MKRQLLPPHTPPSDYEDFLASLPPAERALHVLAQKHVGLGSSYFVEKSHGYRAYCSLKAVNAVNAVNAITAVQDNAVETVKVVKKMRPRVQK